MALPLDENASVERSKGNGALTSSEPQVGEVLAGKYELRGVIGRGGFGVVYEALHLGIQRKIALKVLPAELSAKDPDLAIRFRREGLLASELRHPNTITIYDHGHDKGGLLYMAMEFVHGQTLASVLREEAPVSGRRVVHIVRQILGSLSEAHQRGSVHRDLKPGNIMLTRLRGDADFVKVLDFGIAKAVSSDLLEVPDVAQALTQEGRFCGTPRYMAPEQFRNAPISPAVDIYSLGLIAYELLTGLPAVQGETMVDLIVAQVTGPNLSVPEGAELESFERAALNKALKKAPAERFKSAQEFLAALQPPAVSAGGDEGHEVDFTVELPRDVNPFQGMRRPSEEVTTPRVLAHPDEPGYTDEHRLTFQDMPALPNMPSSSIKALLKGSAEPEETTHPQPRKRALPPTLPPPLAAEVLESTMELRAEEEHLGHDEATIDIAASDVLATQLKADYYKHMEQARSAEIEALSRPARRGRGPSANPSSFDFEDDGPTQQVTPRIAQRAAQDAHQLSQRRGEQPGAEVEPLKPAPTSTGSRALLYAGVGVVALLAAAGCLVMVWSQLGGDPPAAKPPPEEGGAELVKIDVKTIPANATLRVDDQAMGLTPRSITRPRNARVTINIQKEGYFGFTEVLDFNADREHVIRLKPTKP